MARNLTLDQIAQKVITRLSMYPGTSVQLYAEDKIHDSIQSTFEELFDDLFWPQFSSWQSWTLNETTGEVTAALTSTLKRWEDLQVVFRDGANRPLPRLPYGMNPYEITGTTARYLEPHNTNSRIFRVWPLASEGTLYGRVRTLPAVYTADDAIDFDSEALILSAAYKVAEDDGGNPGMIDKFSKAADRRIMQLKQNLNNQAIPILNSADANVPTEWDGTGFTYGWRP